MWSSSGKPPPIPSGADRTPAPSNPYTSKAQSQELEQLRQRGLAKVLHKHLQAVCRKLANEQAAADAALADLESRKANMTEFQVSGELVGLESLTLKATKWKAECRQKEKEALLLYQRYCDKFGKNPNAVTPSKDSGAVPLPMSPLSPESPALSAKLAAPPPNTPPVLPNIEEDLTNLPDILKEAASMDGHHNDDQDFRQYYRDQTRNDGSESFMEEPLFLQEDDNLSVVSGLTSVNSAMTKTIMPLVERDVQEFLQQEQSAIQELLSAEEEQRSANSSELDSVAKVTEQAECMAQQMQEMLQSFENSQDAMSDSSAKEPQKPRRVLDDNWVVYYDETFQREYYHHTVSGQSQWELPNSPATPAADESTSSTTSHAIGSNDMDNKVSRITLYRQRQRKKRRRQRRVFIAMMGVALIAAAGYYWYHNKLTSDSAVREMLVQQQDQEAAEKLQKQQEQEKAEELKRKYEKEIQEKEKLEAEHRQAEKERLAKAEAAKDKAERALMQQREQDWQNKVASAPKKAAHRAVGMDAYCAHVTADSPLASVCF